MLDQALALRMITVTKEGEIVEGTAKLTHGQDKWYFTPKKHWQPGAYQIEVDPSLEDLAGNTLGYVFDRETISPKVSQHSEIQKLKFSIKPLGTPPFQR